jgi:hypothetical protein
MDAPFPVIYQKMAGRFSRWWCKPHKREADHVRLTPHQVRVVCDPKLGGILLPCDCLVIGTDD